MVVERKDEQGSWRLARKRAAPPMTIRAHLDSAFAEQFGLPQIEPPIAPRLAVTEYRMDGIMIGSSDLENVQILSSDEFLKRYLETNGIFADIAINNRESVEGICVEDEPNG